MSMRIRFSTAKGVFDAFDQLKRSAPPPADDVDALDYARELARSTQPHFAIAYIAHLLPRREAIWWACRCVEALVGREAGGEPLRMAEAWVREPDDERRRAALELGRALDPSQAPTHLALAVGHSGGSLVGPEHPAMAPLPHSCALSVHAAVVLGAVSAGDPARCSQLLRNCAAAGVAFAEGGDAKVTLMN